MIRHITLSLLAATGLAFVSAASHAQDIQWAPNIDEARVLAAQQNKLLLIHFWTPTCGPCKIVDRDIFPSPAVVQAINENYVPLKVNADVSRDLVAHFGVDRWPTDIISTVDGRALERMVTPYTQSPMVYAGKLTLLAQQNTGAAQYQSQVQTAQVAEPVGRAVTQVQNIPQGIGPRKPSALAQIPTMSQEAEMRAQQSRQTPIQQRGPGAKFGVQTPNLNLTRNLPPNEAFARRPGIDPNMQPGAAVGAKQPGYQPPQLGNIVGGMTPTTPSRYGNMPAVSGSATNQPVIAGAASQMTGRSVAQSEITNPYATAKASSVSPQNQVAASPVENKFAGAQSHSQIQLPPQSPSRFDNSAPGTFASQPAQTAPQAAAIVGSPMLPSPMSQPSPKSNADIAPIGGSNNPPLGLDGRCPVWLITKGEWKKGDKRWGAVHRGQTYLFTSQDAQLRFLASPDDYSPVLAGMDVVRLATDNMVTQGVRRYGVLFDVDGAGPQGGRMYLFDSVDSRNRFEADPDRYLAPVMQAMKTGKFDRFIK